LAGLRGSQQAANVNGQQVPLGGDVITAVDGHPVKSMEDLISYLTSSTDVGQTVTMTILRDGKEQSIKVTLVPRPNT
jgi:S1-C subfamily serine protease